jgi:hypothetical protein
MKPNVAWRSGLSQKCVLYRYSHNYSISHPFLTGNLTMYGKGITCNHSNLEVPNNNFNYT